MAETITANVETVSEQITATIIAGSETITAIVNADPRGPVGGGGGGASDVSELTTTGLTAGNMLRVATAGGLEERTPAQVLSDIGAATADQGALADTALQPYECRSEHDGTYLYIGTAPAGTSESTANWTIKRQLFSGTATITTTTATGVAWTNRLNATYT